MSIHSRLWDRLKERTSRQPKGDLVVATSEPKSVTLSPRLRARIQARVNGRKSTTAIAVVVKDSGKVFYFRSAWAKNSLDKRRAKNKVAKASRKRNR